MNLDRLQAFVVFSEHLNFTRAAAALCVSQPALHAQVARLSETLGVRYVFENGPEVDPLSPKHHFVLANLLQKKSLVYEAIEEYETTVELKPDYFPALTRLAYLYYKKGFSAKAAQVWERSLLYCTDDALRRNIEEFIASLRTEK